MSKFFVNANDEIKVEVYAWETNGDIAATHDKSQVPEDADAEVVGFTFRKPNYSDTTRFMQVAQIGGENPDVAGFQDIVLRSLLKDWTLTDNDGKKVPIKANTVNKLESAVAMAATAGCLEKMF